MMIADSRPMFEESAAELLARSIPSAMAFCSLGRDARRRKPGVRVGSGALANEPVAIDLLEKFGLNAAPNRDPARRVFRASELWPEVEQSAPSTIASRLARSIVLVLRQGEETIGVAGLERSPGEPPFSDADLVALEDLGRYLAAGADAELELEELADELAAIRAVYSLEGTVLIVGAEPNPRGPHVATTDLPEVAAERLQLVADAARALFESGGDALCPLVVPRANGTILRVAALARPISGRSLALHVVFEEQRMNDNLSRREREIARMLVSGYTAVNIAATYGLSENTVRTYMRRLYRKLAVNNRADLVRHLLAPDWHAGSEPPPSAAKPISELERASSSA
jgi:DNA-binding CsgD family transcriptional regulator